MAAGLAAATMGAAELSANAESAESADIERIEKRTDAKKTLDRLKEISLALYRYDKQSARENPELSKEAAACADEIREIMSRSDDWVHSPHGDRILLLLLRISAALPDDEQIVLPSTEIKLFVRATPQVASQLGIIRNKLTEANKQPRANNQTKSNDVFANEADIALIDNTLTKTGKLSRR